MIPISYETNKKTVTLPMEEYEGMKAEIAHYRTKVWEGEAGLLRDKIAQLLLELHHAETRPWYKKLFGIK